MARFRTSRALLFPSGSYFPSYTLTAALSGAVYGWILHGCHGIVRILLAYLVTTLSVTLGLNTFWIALGRGYQYVEAAGAISQACGFSSHCSSPPA